MAFDDADAHEKQSRSPQGMLHLMEDLISKFDGQDRTYPVQQWVQDIEDNGDIFNWSPTQRLLVARRSLTGTAALWLRAEKTYKSWDELKQAICKEFPDTIDIKTIHELMSNRKKKPNESCLDYMLTMKELGKRGKMPDYVAIKYIVDGIPDYEINKVMLYGVSAYTDLKEKLKIYESIKAKTQKKQPQPSTSKTNHPTWVRCYNCGEKSHKSEDCPQKKQGKKCCSCNEYGHISQLCPRKAEKNPSSSSDATTWSSQNGGTSSSGSRLGASGSNGVPKRSFITSTSPAALGGVAVGDIDSSKMAAIEKCHGGVDIFDVNKQNVNGLIGKNKPIKWVKLLCGLKNKYETCDSAVVEIGCGNNALVDSGSEINLISSDFYAEIGSPECVHECITLTGLGFASVITQGSFQTSVEIDNSKFDDVRFCIIPKDSMPYKIILGHEFLRNVVTVMKDGCVWMKPNDWMSEIQCFPCSVDSVGYVKDEGLRHEVARLVDEYKPCQTKEAPIELKITLRDDIPVASRPRRVSPKEQDEIDKQISEWLEDGIIRVSFSEYASPLVLVRKKDGSIRICVDYRLLNKKILKDEYPLPIIDDHIDRLASARVFSAIDLKNGFFHLRVHEDSIKYTSFVTMKSQYEFLKAPFGLATCPKVFTRFISIIFRDLIARGIVLIFIDDLLIPAMSEEQAVERLKEVLNRASEYGLQINWKKTQLLVRKVEYLGYIIEEGTVRPSPGKTDAVMKFPEPKNEKQLHSFLGLCSYFRKFIENYAMIARPLTEMLKKDKKFEFNDEHRVVFKILKEKLASKPVLKIYDQNAETELHTDASCVAYAAILMQKDCYGELHPVHYMSRKTSDAESRYTSYELEALAIIEGIKKFRHYLYGKHFKIVTDCKAFQMTLNKKDLAMSTRVARWILFLQDYDYEIEHRDCSKMRHADALSRNPYIAMIFSDLHSDLLRAQECDDGLKATMEILREEKSYSDFYLHGGVLCKGPEQCVVVPQKMEVEIIKRAHDNGHFSKKKMMELIGKEYYISNLGRKIEEYIATYIPCLLASRKSGKQEGFLSPIEKGDKPLDTLHVDHIGPMTETRKQYNYILTMVDGFTKFVWLFPTKTTSTQEVINKLLIYQQTYGNPRRIISDRGTAFTSNDFSNFCKEEDIEHIKITTGVPRGNGQVERVHRTLISVMTKLSIEKPTQWYKLVSRVQRALNSTFQRSINTTPFELLIGTKMKRKEDIELYDLLMQEKRSNFMDNREELRKNAKKQILDIQEENKRNYNKSKKPSNIYKEGDLVCIKRTQFGTGMKLKPKFLGPYKITKAKRNHRYDVEKADNQAEGPNKTSSSSDFMKPWPDYESKPKEPGAPVSGPLPRLLNIARNNFRGLIGFFVPLFALSWQGEKGQHDITVQCMWIWMAWFFLFQPVKVPVTGMIPLFLLPMAGVLSSVATCGCYMNESIVLFLLGSILALLLNNSGSDKRFALWLLCFGGAGSAKKLIFKSATAAFALSIISNRLIVTSTIMEFITPTLMSLPSDSATEPNFDEVRYIVCNAIHTASSIGSLALPHSAIATLAMRAMFYASPATGFVYAETFNYFQYTVYAFPVALVMHLLNTAYHIILMTVCVKKPMSSTTTGQVHSELMKHKEALPKDITLHEKLSLFFTVFYLIMFLTRWNNYFSWADYSKYATAPTLPAVADSTVAAMFVILLHVLPNGFDFIKLFLVKDRSELPPTKPQSGILWWRFVDKNMNYGYIFLLGSGVALTVAIRVTKLNESITTGSGEIITDQTWNVAIFLVCFVAVALANVMTSVAACVIWCPFILNMTANKNYTDVWVKKMYLGALGVGLGSSLGFMFPFLYTPAYFCHYEGKVPILKMARYGIGSSIICMIILWLSLCFWGPLLWDPNNEGIHVIIAPPNSTL